MIKITLATNGERLEVIDRPIVACGDQNSVQLEVAFCGAWDGYAKTAVFYCGHDTSTVYEMVLDTDNCCMIPAEVLASACDLYIGLRGVKGDGSVLTSEVLSYTVKPGAPGGTETPEDPTPTVYEQIMAQLEETNANYNAVSEQVSAMSGEVQPITRGGTDATSLAAAQENLGIKANSNRITEAMTAINKIASDLNTQKSRIDQFTSLAAGSTTGDAELLDIRVGADGTTYSTAGDAVRGQVGDLRSALEDYNALPFNNWNKQNTTWNGVTFSWVDDVCSVSGTATADSYINLYNGELPNADRFNININSSSEDIFVRVYFMGGSTENYISTNKSCSVSIPDGYSSMIVRLTVFKGVTVDGTISVNLFNCNTSNNTSALIPYIYPNTGLDCTDVIEKALLDFGCVYLDKGEYIITDLQMPDNTRLTGKGKATKLLVSDYNHHAIICGSGCTIDNVEIVGKYTSYESEIGSGSGIYIEGNQDAAPYVYNTKILNVTIHGFAQAGIYAYNTGLWCANSLSVVNCEIYWCHAGIFTSQYSEFGRFTNIICRNNYIGCLNNGGNNVFVCCTLSNNTVGFYIKDVNAEHNGSHGSCIGCQINHSGGDTGNAIILKNILHGFVFSACQIWYGKIYSENTGDYVGKPITFNACEFGGGAPTITAWSRVLLNGCTFMATPTLGGWADNRGITVANCYDAEMNAITK